MKIRRLTAVLALVLALLGVTVSTATAGGNEVKGNAKQATAATLSCGTSGTSYQQIAGIAELVVTYNSCTGYNSARMNHIANTYGVATYTSVSLVKVTRSGAWLGPQVINAGTFSYYAGPVSVYAPSDCVRAQGIIKWNGATFQTDTGPVGCGGAPYQF